MSHPYLHGDEPGGSDYEPEKSAPYQSNPYQMNDPYRMPVQSSVNAFAVASLITGLASLLFSFIPFVNVLCFILGVAAIVLGIIALKKSATGKGMSITGIVTGGFSLLISVTVLLMLGALMAAWESQPGSIEGREYRINMSATTSDGEEALVTYDTGDGPIEEIFTSDWNKESKYYNGYGYENVSVSGATVNTEVSCTLSIDGKTVSQKVGKGGVTCTSDPFDF